jgi:UDP-glucose 4-epimerase
MADLYQTDLVAYYRPARCGDVRVSIGDPRNAAERLGFKAEATLIKGLTTTLDLASSRVERKPLVVA